jgi:hypothetical protein
VADDEAPGPQAYPANAAHLMRTAQLAQLQLSAMADTKANILMGATFVIFTITIGQARGGAAAFFSAVFAMLSVIPKIGRDEAGAGSNLLFFGVFTAMSEEAFIDEITDRIRTEEGIYRTMARDIHQNGMVLQHKKYRMLGWAYRVLLAGLVASAAAFVAQRFL